MEHRTGPQFSSARFAKKFVMFSYGFYLLFLFRDDVIKRFLSERYLPLTVGASVLLMLASVSYSSYSQPDEDCCAHEHSHEKRRPKPFFILALSFICVLAPVVWGFAEPASVMGASSILLKNKGVFTATSAMVDPKALCKPDRSDKSVKFNRPGEAPQTIVYTPINIMELLMLLSGRGDAFAGDRVAIQGFVDLERGQTNKFTLVRYFIPCCIVHAVPVMMSVASAETHTLATDQWITVYGIIRKQKSIAGNPENGDPSTSYYIEAEMIEKSNTPTDPYISRSFFRKPFNF